MGTTLARNYTGKRVGSQVSAARCPGHSIHFLRYGYTVYINEALALAGMSIEDLELKQYEDWTPYQ